MSRTYVDTESMADYVFGYLSDHDATLEEACSDLGITPSQFRRGLAYIKDVLADANTSPVVYDPQTYRYSLAIGEADKDSVKVYEVHRLKIAQRQLQRLRTGTAEPAARLFQSSTNVRRFLHYLDSAQSELALLLEEVDGQAAAR